MQAGATTVTTCPARSRNRFCRRIDTCAPPSDSRCWSANISTCTRLLRQRATAYSASNVEGTGDVVHRDGVERRLLHAPSLFGPAVRTSVSRAASSSASPGVNRKPFSPSCTRWGRATAFAATIGRPDAMASIVAIDCSSAIEAIAKTLAREYRSRRSSSEACPWKVTHPRHPELLREGLELRALVAAADDVEGDVEGGVELRQGPQDDVDVLLGRQRPTKRMRLASRGVRSGR